MSLALTILIHALIIGSIIVVHELGHYVAGRMAGVKAPSMRVTVWKVPPHVAQAPPGCRQVRGTSSA